MRALPLALLLACGGSDPQPEPEPEPVTEGGEAPPPAAQTEQEAFEVLCNESIEALLAQEDVHAEDKARWLAEWIDAHVEHESVRELFASLATMAPAERIAAITDAASAAGVEPCRLVEIWDYPDRPEPEPAP